MDEHIGEAGMLTRIESFVEMVRRKRKKLGLSPREKIKIKSAQDV